VSGLTRIEIGKVYIREHGSIKDRTDQRREP